MFKHIVIPTDYFPGFETVFARARRLAEAHGSQLTVVHVTEASDDAERVAQQQTWARQQTEQPLRFAEVAGRDVAENVVRFAHETGADLLVLGTHGHRDWLHPALGGVSGEVVRTATCPVLTVPLQNEVRTGGWHHVLVPIDFSEHAAQALRVGKALAKASDGVLSLLFVEEERLVPLFNDTGLPTLATQRLDPDILAQAGQALAQLDAETPGPEVLATYHVQHGHPAREILQFAHDAAVHLIVMSTHGLSGHDFFRLGSVTERVVRKAPCEVLVLKAA